MATQSELIELILTIQPGQVIIVEAEAGSGKTTSVMAAIAAMAADKNVAICAPTHVAKEELEDKLGPGTKCNVTFATSASLVGRFLKMNKDTGEMENRFSPKNCDWDLIVMDEIGATTAVDVQRVLRGNSPVVMLGDRQQLDAVKSRTADIWTDNWQNYEHRSFTYVGLDEQWRANGPLYEFVSGARDKINIWTKSFQGGRLFYNTDEFEQDFVNQLSEAYRLGKDLSQYCMFAYRNATVNRIANQMRQKVFGQTSETEGFAVGEVLRCNSSDVFPTGRLVTVLETLEVTTTLIAGELILTSHLHVRSAKGEEHWLKVVHPSHLDHFAEVLQNAKDDRDWDKFYKLEEGLSVFVNANVMTAHKSQGRTVKHVWVHVTDIGSRRKLLYVSYGRASKMLTGVWPAELWGTPKRLFGDATIEQLTLQREQFTHH